MSEVIKAIITTLDNLQFNQAVEEEEMIVRLVVKIVVTKAEDLPALRQQIKDLQRQPVYEIVVADRSGDDATKRYLELMANCTSTAHYGTTGLGYIPAGAAPVRSGLPVSVTAIYNVEDLKEWWKEKP